MWKLLLRGVVGCDGEEVGKEQCLEFVSYLGILLGGQILNNIPSTSSFTASMEATGGDS